MMLAPFSGLRAALLGLLLVAAPLDMALAQESVADALGVPGPIHFMGEDYALSWTSHPTPDYYKQEYLPAGQQTDSYTAMFMIDALTSEATPQAAANGQIAGLEARKATDPMVNYRQITNSQTGEVVLDFLLSDSSSATPILEWNAYRYAKVGDGIALYAISRRAYGADGDALLAELGQLRKDNINALTALELPPITPAE